MFNHVLIADVSIAEQWFSQVNKLIRMYRAPRNNV